MSQALRFLTLELYSGSDITNALANSQVNLTAPMRGTFGRFELFVNLAGDLRNVQLVPRHCVVTGRERDSGETMTVLFSGSLRATNLRAREILGNSEFTSREVRSAASLEPDVVVTDHLWARPWLRWRKSIRVPKWVRQELPVASTWDETVSALPRKLRRDIARLLRKFEYRLCLDQRSDALPDFYRELHLPYVQARFANDALAVDESAFLHESRNATRLNLMHNNAIVAACLVKRDGEKLLIRRNSMKADADWLKGRADVMDYYCLLLAQLLGCKILDFGLSRPHIMDGPFRYKAKWRTRIVRSGGSEPATCISPIRPTAATLAFLRRNYFIQQANSNFFVRILYDHGSPADTIARLEDKTRNLGLTQVQLACHRRTEISDPSNPLPANFRIQRLSDPRDPIYQLLEHP